MDFLFIAYVLICIILISGSFFINYISGRITMAGILAIGFLVTSIVFGIRWFPGGSLVTTTPTGSWPPTINVCPDFLSLTKVAGKHYCVDPIGVSRRVDANTGMERWTSPDQTDAKFLFNLFLDQQGDARLNSLYAECKRKGVTWEGVFDGSVGLGNQPPTPA